MLVLAAHAVRTNKKHRGAQKKSNSSNEKDLETTEKVNRKHWIAPPEPEPLSYFRVNQASSTIVRAFENDPVFAYINGPNKPLPPGYQVAMRLFWRVSLMQRIRSDIAMMVDKGFGVCISTWAPDDPKSNPDAMDSLINIMVRWMTERASKDGGEETKKRIAEFQEKTEKEIARCIGPEKKREMMYLDLLATDPDFQGRGYGSALVKYTNDLADSRNRATWLMSSNVANTEFYESLGYVVKGTAVLGDDNPEWDEDPVLVHIMVRERK